MPSRDGAQPLITRVSECMKQANWTHMVDAEKERIVIIASDNIAGLTLVIRVRERQEQLISTLSFERRCPEAYHTRLVELCNIRNWQLIIGFLSIDVRDGDVQIRHSADIVGLQITAKFMDSFIKVVLGVARRSYKGVCAFIEGKSVEDAVASID